MSSKPIERFFEYSPNVRIHYTTRGGGSPTVLMLHGFGASLESWNDLSPLLPEEWRLVQVDLKGFGLSSKPRDEAYTIFDQADIVLALARHLGLSEYVLVGHSYGGSVAMASYLRNSGGQGATGSIRSLILIDSPCYPQSFPLFIRILRTPLLNRLSQNLTSPRFRAAYILKHIFRDRSRVTAERVDRYARYFDLPGSHDAMINAARQLIPADPAAFTAQIRKVSVPTLIVWGQSDPLIHLWQAEKLNKDIPASKLAILTACGHVPQEEKPEELAGLLLDFIK